MDMKNKLNLKKIGSGIPYEINLDKMNDILSKISVKKINQNGVEEDKNFLEITNYVLENETKLEKDGLGTYKILTSNNEAKLKLNLEQFKFLEVINQINKLYNPFKARFYCYNTQVDKENLLEELDFFVVGDEEIKFEFITLYDCPGNKIDFSFFEQVYYYDFFSSVQNKRLEATHKYFFKIFYEKTKNGQIHRLLNEVPSEYEQILSKINKLENSISRQKVGCFLLLLIIVILIYK